MDVCVWAPRRLVAELRVQYRGCARTLPRRCAVCCFVVYAVPCLSSASVIRFGVEHLAITEQKHTIGTAGRG